MGSREFQPDDLDYSEKTTVPPLTRNDGDIDYERSAFMQCLHLYGITEFPPRRPDSESGAAATEIRGLSDRSIERIRRISDQDGVDPGQVVRDAVLARFHLPPTLAGASMEWVTAPDEDEGETSVRLASDDDLTNLIVAFGQKRDMTRAAVLEECIDRYAAGRR